MAIHAAVADALRRRILAGDLPIGSRLPSEAQLCAEWKASRGTVRQALAALRAEGLIGGGPGAPPVVRSRHLSQSFETFLSFTRWAHLIGRTPGQHTIEVARRRADQLVADALNLEEGDPVVQVLRVRLLDEVPAMLERTTFVEPAGRLLFDADLDHGSIYDHLIGSGVDLSNARHVIDAVAADAVDAAALDVPVGAPLLRERRHTTSASGEPQEYSDDRYRPDLVSFTVVNTQELRPTLSRTLDPGWTADAS